MEGSSWFIVLSLCLSTAITILFILLSKSQNKTSSKLSLPPSPPGLPILGHLHFIPRLVMDPFSLLRELRDKYGPIVTIRIGSKILIFISGHSLAHQALIQKGSAFNHRPGPVSPSCMVDNRYLDCGSSSGDRWRVLRRNLNSELLVSSRYKSFGRERKWVLQIIKNALFQYHVKSDEKPEVVVADHFTHAMFCLLLFVCFGEELDEKTIQHIEDIERYKLANFQRLNIFTFVPTTVGRFIFRKRWLQLVDLRRKQQSALLPLVKARRLEREERIKRGILDGSVAPVSYLNSLFDVEIKEEGGRKLFDEEIVILIAEVLDAGSDTTATVFEWVMAHLLKDQNIQEKLYSEIIGVVSPGEEIREEDLQKMPYLKAVVLEGLRIHPPTHFVLPHTVKEDTVLGGHVIPKNAYVNFLVAEMGRDPQVWKDPMEFRPERFLGDEGTVDVTGSKELKMMPFSAGRRICPGLGLGTLHLEFFLANLIRDFKWTAVEGHDIDMSEKMEFTTIMVTPLRAHVSPRAV